MWLNIFTLAIRELENYPSQGFITLMAILETDLIPLIEGLVADNIGLQNSIIAIIG